MGKYSSFVTTIGWIGALLSITAYTLNIFLVIESNSIGYAVMNLMAALLLGWRLYSEKNHAHFLVNAFFGCISLIALVKVFI